MRITDVALSTATPLSSTARTATKKADTGSTAPTVVPSASTDGAQHPDEVAAAALQRAASAAHATRVVAAENQRASDSARGEITGRL